MKLKVPVLAALCAILVGLGFAAGLLVSHIDGDPTPQAADAAQRTDISAKDQCRLMLADFYENLNEIADSHQKLTEVQRTESERRLAASIPFVLVGEALSAEAQFERKIGGQCRQDLYRPMTEILSLYQEGTDAWALWAGCPTCTTNRATVEKNFQQAGSRLIEFEAVWRKWGKQFQ